MPFGDHLEELRRRLVHSLVGLAPIFFISLWVGKPVTDWLLLPVEHALMAADNAPLLQQTGPLEYFGSYMKVSAILTLVVGSPWVLYQAWLFVAPGLYTREKRFAYLLAPLSTCLTVSGLAFLYWVMLPLMLRFFVIFSSNVSGVDAAIAPLPAGIIMPAAPVLEADPENPPVGSFWVNNTLKQMRICVQPAVASNDDSSATSPPKILCIPLAPTTGLSQQYRVSEYLNLVLTLALSFAVAFQMPVVVLLLGWAGIIEVATLAKYRRHAMFTCAFLGAALTPTSDPLSMALMTLPLYGLYEFGLLLVRFLPASRVAGADATHNKGTARSTNEYGEFTDGADSSGRARAPDKADRQ